MIILYKRINKYLLQIALFASNMSNPLFSTLLVGKLKRARDDSEEHSPIVLKKPKSLFDEMSFSSSSSSSPSSSQSGYSSHDSQEEDEGKEEEKQSTPGIYTFELFDDRTAPFGFDSTQDVLLLDANSTDCISFIERYAAEDKKINLFARHIHSFKNGSIVSKHQTPFGDNARLCNELFVIMKKIYRADGTLASVILRESRHANQAIHAREFMIKSAFFHGWVDCEALKVYEAFCSVDVTQ